ncbi:heavy-metal-associated domain-containing protein [Leucobacter denitrificans]|uniref:Heavy-metal-associated domain-containing protein n=1 Tax=Leucobacter denitrificans TaxID=683042 RepID=A0A7G9S325_9MICO|nr:heavy-metal-associated domain-containing protein [Leucobacter denitrificans]QNN62250.1 heavy-metal-associated domain-containing protein [Leucobacter denitrificans]
METIEYTVTGMTCGNCENHVREEVSEIPGVTVEEVNRETKVLRITSANPVDDAAVIAAVDEAGYTAVRA